MSSFGRAFLHSGRLPASLSVLLVSLVLPLSGCGESKAEQASKTVCNARSDIKSRVATLKTLTPSVATLPQIKEEVSAIVDDVKKIQSAQGDLEPARKQQVEHATQTFERNIESVVSNLTSSLSLSGAGAQLETALRKLGSDYAQALEPIECS
jgi:Tfp pilus assembly protein PilP